MKKLSIIIPAYNEEKRIGKTLKEYGKYFENLKKKGKLDFEIVVVINNTTDKTEEVVKDAKNKYPEIRHLNFEQGGKGFAIIQGYKNALKRKNDLIGFVDADMSTKPNAYYELVKNIYSFDGIIASRRMKESVIEKSLKRTIISLTFNSIVRFLFRFPYKDTQCGAKLTTRTALESIIGQLTQPDWLFDIDYLYHLKNNEFNIREFPTVWEDKEGSKITNIFKTSWEMFLGLFKLRFILYSRQLANHPDTSHLS
jgi:glycosyltransferase involved in cell wall biosynthesis